MNKAIIVISDKMKLLQELAFSAINAIFSILELQDTIITISNRIIISYFQSLQMFNKTSL